MSRKVLFVSGGGRVVGCGFRYIFSGLFSISFFRRRFVLCSVLGFGGKVERREFSFGGWDSGRLFGVGRVAYFLFIFVGLL